MFYQFTGQPGHGKSVLAIERVLTMVADHEKNQADAAAKGKPIPPDRPLYVCNVRDFDHSTAGSIPLTPDELKLWHHDPNAPGDPTKINPAYENAIILVDECYEHGMFPKRAPGSKVPEHVQRVAKHRHWGIDFVMVCQSPKKQMDDFLHDLMEEHYHIRRRYGLPFVHVKRWDRFEPYPDKALPLTAARRSFPKHIFKLYTSTKYDTSERRVPWFYPAAAALLVALLIGTWYTVGSIREKFTPQPLDGKAKAEGTHTPSHASAGVGVGGQKGQAEEKWRSVTDYAKDHLPRFPTLPWTAPVFDSRSVTADPQLYCMSSGQGVDGLGNMQDFSCTCLTEQGTTYTLSQAECRKLARSGPEYNPYKQSAQQQDASPHVASGALGVSSAPVGSARTGSVITRGQRVQGTFPKSPGYSASGTVTPPTDYQL